MRRLAMVAVLALPFALPPAHRAAAMEAMSGDVSVLQRVLPGVVNISTWTQKEQPSASGGGTTRRWTRLYGSGFIVDSSGLIVTNQHVIAGAQSITVTFNDRRLAPATVLAATAVADIAVLRVNVPGPLPALRFGNSDELQVGEPVLAIGNPLGVGTSVSSGIISALNRDIQDSPYDDFIQTDAAINHGNSGGPLIDMQGQVIGLDTALFSNAPNGGSIGLGFAIPSNDVSFVVGRLIRFGRVNPGWSGLRLQDVGPDIAQTLGLPRVAGAIVAGVQPDSPAARAGVQEGDVVLTYGARPVSDARALMRGIATTPEGQTVVLGIWRNGRDITVPLTVASMPEETAQADTSQARMAAAQNMAPMEIGVHLSALTDATRKQYQLGPAQNGVLVTAVDSGSIADSRGLVPGDVIVKVGNKTVESPADVHKVMSAARARGEQSLLILVHTSNGQRWYSVPVHESDAGAAPARH